MLSLLLAGIDYKLNMEFLFFFGRGRGGGFLPHLNKKSSNYIEHEIFLQSKDSLRITFWFLWSNSANFLELAIKDKSKFFMYKCLNARLRHFLENDSKKGTIPSTMTLNPSNAIRLLSSKTQAHKDFSKNILACHAGIHWIALAEHSQMSIHVPGCSGFFVSFYIIKRYHNFLLDSEWQNVSTGNLWIRGGGGGGEALSLLTHLLFRWVEPHGPHNKWNLWKEDVSGDFSRLSCVNSLAEKVNNKLFKKFIMKFIINFSYFQINL